MSELKTKQVFNEPLKTSFDDNDTAFGKQGVGEATQN